MSELEQQTRQDDPIASLHRMSTTAGATTQDYVAINNLAVASSVLGFATSLAFLGLPFLVLALGAIVCGIFALRQIRNSNGTQGGIAWAWFGIVLALLISGAVFADHYRQRQVELAEVRLVNEAVNRLGKLIVAGEYRAAYDLLDDEFKAQWTFEQFEQTWKRQQDPERGGGALLEMYGNGIVQFSIQGDGTRLAYTQTIVRFEKSRDGGGRLTTVLKKGPDGQYRPTHLVELFKTRQ